MCSVRDDGLNVSAQWVFVWCRAQADGSTMRSALEVGGEMRSRKVAGSAARTSPLFRCRGDVKCHTTLLPSELSPDSLTPFGGCRQIYS